MFASRSASFFASSILSLSICVGAGAIAACSAAEDASSSSDDVAENQSYWSSPGWDEAQRKIWYTTPQGSHLIDYGVFMALERPDSGELLATAENLVRHGFVYPPKSELGVFTDARLPLGVVKDRLESEKRDFVGLTCAGCHTGEIRVKGKGRLLVDGGQSFVDFEPFFDELQRALGNTISNPDKKKRFCAALEDGANCDKRLVEAKGRIDGIQTRNRVIVKSGPGRLDAFTRILNEILSDQLGTEKPEPVAAPISYPQVWDAPRLSCVQTNCSSKNPMTRNIGETLGVFGHAKLVKNKDGSVAISATSKVQNLYALEKSLESLQSPKWNSGLFGAIDTAKKAQGEKIFEARCASCHTEPYKFDPAVHGAVAHNDHFAPEMVAGRSNDLWKVTTLPYKEAKTDPAFIEISAGRMVDDPTLTALFDAALRRGVAAALQEKLGRAPSDFELEAAVKLKSAQQLLDGTRRIDGSVSALLVLGGVTGAIEAANVAALAQSSGREPASVKNELEFFRAPVTEVDLKIYRARPLNGIAFTAPFGHDGAWPTLRDVLEPAANRPRKFPVRRGSFDPSRVGLDTSELKSGEETFIFDTNVVGNGRGGHEYGVDLLPNEKDALIEYLKSL